MNDEQKIEVFITKYALTSGITRLMGEISKQFPEMVSANNPGCYGYCFHGEGCDWHRTWASALGRAEQMRAKKIISLEKQIKKLRAMKFVEPQQLTK